VSEAEEEGDEGGQHPKEEQGVCQDIVGDIEEGRDPKDGWNNGQFGVGSQGKESLVKWVDPI